MASARRFNVDVQFDNVELPIGVRLKSKHGSVFVVSTFPPLLDRNVQGRAINENWHLILPYEERQRGRSLKILEKHPALRSRQWIFGLQ